MKKIKLKSWKNRVEKTKKSKKKSLKFKNFAKLFNNRVQDSYQQENRMLKTLAFKALITTTEQKNNT